MIMFETPRLIVRHYTIEDLENFYLLNSDVEVMRYIRPVKTRIETDVFLREILQRSKENPKMGRWAVDEKSGDKAVGSVVIIPVDNSDKIQLGYALFKTVWGKG
jgi:ribosomal-protein-alanine N-acetyltransferase